MQKSLRLKIVPSKQWGAVQAVLWFVALSTVLFSTINTNLLIVLLASLVVLGLWMQRCWKDSGMILQFESGQILIDGSPHELVSATVWPFLLAVSCRKGSGLLFRRWLILNDSCEIEEYRQLRAALRFLKQPH